MLIESNFNLPKLNTKMTNDNIEEISFSDISKKIKNNLNYLVQRWLILFVSAIVFAGLGIGYSVIKKPYYIAVSSFTLEDSGTSGGASALGQYAGLASMVGIDIGGGGGIFQGDNILELYKSRSMIKEALLTTVKFKGKEERLIDRFISFNKLRNKFKGDAKTIDFNRTDNLPKIRLQDSVISLISDDINKEFLNVSKPDKKLSIINVSVKSKDEDFSKLFNDVIVATVNKFYIETRTKKSLQNLNILIHQTDSVRNVVNGAIYFSAATLDATPNLNPTRQILRAPVQKSQLNAEANKLILSELIKNLELSKINIRKETPLIQIIDSPVYPLEKEKIIPAGYGLTFFLLGLIFTSVILLFKRKRKKN